MASNLTAQLSAIAWIALFWNEIEENVDTIMCRAMQIPDIFWVEVATRINGIDGKIELIRIRMRHDLGGEKHKLFQLISKTLGDIKEIKKHRDAVVHTNPDFDTGTGKTVGRRGKIVTVNIALPTLDIIRQHANALCEESATINQMLHLGQQHANQVEVGDASGKVSQRPEFQALTAQLLNEQKMRAKLPRLPPVPK